MTTRLFLLLILMLPCTAFANRKYVAASAMGNNDGTSWLDAYTDLQTAFANVAPGDSIWVAAGTYKPTSGSDRSISFAVPSGIVLLGGFNGTETSETQRQPHINLCVLSGNIGNTASDSDNSYHVVTTANVAASTIIDGFTIREGRYTDVSMIYSGAGLYNSGGSPVIRQCTFSYNIAGRGAAVAQVSSGSMQLHGCTFVYNTSTSNSTITGGGAIHILAGSITVSTSSFSFNTANSGGAIQLGGGIMKMDRCILSANTANTAGGAIYGSGADFTLTLTNSLVVGNISNGGASAIYCFSSPSRAHKITNNTIAHNAFGSGSNGAALFNNSTVVANCIFAANEESNQVSVGAGLVYGTLIEGINSPSIGFVLPGAAGLAPFAASAYDYHLTLTSDAVDFGLASYLEPGFNQFDLDGEARVLGTAPDAGCYEKNTCPFTPSITTSNPNGLCPGGSLTLSVLGGNNIEWSNNQTSASISITAPGTYSVVLDSAECLGSASIVVANYTPQLTINTPNGVTFCAGNSVEISVVGNDIVSFQWQNGSTETTQQVTSAGTYNVTGTDSYGCTTSAFVQTFVVQPTATITGNLNLCPGESTTLTAAVPNWNTLTWSTGANDVASITVNTAGEYSITGTASEANCPVSASVTVVGQTLPTPLVQYDGALLSTGSFSSYQWYLNGNAINGATLFYYTPTQNGNYSVEVTNPAACSAMSPSLNVTNIGIEEINEGFVRIAPNPSNAVIFIEVSTDLLGQTLSIMDLTGRVVLVELITNSRQSIDLTALTPGNYLVRCGTNVTNLIKE